MAGGKSAYSTNINYQKKLSKHSKKVEKHFYNSFKRRDNHLSKMRPVNMDELVKKYAPNAKAYNEGCKVKFHNENSDYVILADISGYVRVLNLKTKEFVDVYTNNTPNHDYNDLTHFYIERRKKDEKKRSTRCVLCGTRHFRK